MGWFAGQTDWDQVIDDHYVAVHRYAYRLSGQSADADDLAQSTFLQAQRNGFQLREPERVRHWLLRITRNEFLQRQRLAENRHRVAFQEDLLTSTPSQSERDVPDFSSEDLQKALNTLPEGYRTPLVLFYFEEHSYKDIAEHMELPIGTVMSRLARGKQQLRLFLSRPGSTE